MAVTPLQTALVSDKHDERQRSVAEIVRVRLMLVDLPLGW